MKSFEIVNAKSGHSFGNWEANSASEALDKYAQDAGYTDFADACKVASGDDIEARETTITGAESDLCERWLGSDWRSAGYSDAEAVEIAKKCQVKQDDGDARDYTEILAEVVAVCGIKQEVKVWAATDKTNGVRVSADGSIPQITAEMLGRKVDELGLSEDKADALRIELMGIYVEALK